ncbi:AI-2E family transporter [Chloroflexota bacterium]
MHSTTNIFMRYRHLILFVLGVIIILCLLYALRLVVIPLAIGVVLAYLLLPIITWVERKLPKQGELQQTKRVSLIILTYILTLVLLASFSYFIIRAIINAFVVILPNIQLYISASLIPLQEWIEVIRQQFSPAVQQRIDQLLFEAGENVGNAIRSAFIRSISFIPVTFGLILGFASLPVFLFYVLKDSEKLENSFYSVIPAPVAVHVRNIASIIGRVIGRYIRAQLMLGFVVAYLCLVGLLILRINFAFALAAIAGITELIPILGPWIGGAIAVIVTLAIAPEKAIWVVLLFFLVQLLENNLLVPRIQGAYMRIHPAVLIALLLLGGYIAGLWGIILIAPLTATIVEIYKYVHQSAKIKELQEQTGSIN